MFAHALASRSSPFVASVLGSLALLMLPRCIGTAPDRSSASDRLAHLASRTPEELRVFHGLLLLRKDSQYGFAELEIPGRHTHPLKLYIPETELARIEALDATRPHDIRYWYHEERFASDTPYGRAELASLEGPDGPIIDRTFCERHQEAMRRQPVPIIYGLPMGEFIEAARRDFPHAAYSLGGCIKMDAKETQAYACATCEAAYQTWLQSKRDSASR